MIEVYKLIDKKGNKCFCIDGVPPASILEKNLIEKLGGENRTKKGMLISKKEPSLILFKLNAIPFGINLIAINENGEKNMSQNRVEYKDGKILVSVPAMKSNEALKTAFKQYIESATGSKPTWDKDNFVWVVIPGNGIRHTAVQDWFASQGQSFDTSVQVASTATHETASKNSEGVQIQISHDVMNVLSQITSAVSTGKTVTFKVA